MNHLLMIQVALLTIMLLCHPFSFSQSGWINQLNGPGSDLYSIFFSNVDMGTAVGFYGKILRTTNGGLTWTNQSSGVTVKLNSVFFTDVYTGTIVGDNGTILRTTDGGVNWTSQSSGTQSNLTSVFFTNENTGTIVGFSGTILRTTNGGANWTSQLSGTTYILSSIFFTDSNTAIVAGRYVTFGYKGLLILHGIILRTTNSGESWRLQLDMLGYFYSISFGDSNNGTAVGDNGRIIHTTDGGVNWAPQAIGYSLNSVFFVNSDTGTAVGALGTILRTTNGGKTWTSQLSGTDEYLYGVYFIDSNNGYIVGGYNTILHTTNGGITFVEEQRGMEIPLLFSLLHNYPNPFNPTTHISYSVPKATDVTLKIYDVLGQEIAVLINERKQPGEYNVTWNAEGVPSGVYFYRIVAGEFVETKKMVIVR